MNSRARKNHTIPIAVEVNGGAFIPGGGRHTRGAGYRADVEKLAAAAVLGWRVIPCLPEHVKSGAALNWIETALSHGRGGRERATGGSE